MSFDPDSKTANALDDLDRRLDAEERGPVTLFIAPDGSWKVECDSRWTGDGFCQCLLDVVVSNMLPMDWLNQLGPVIPVGAYWEADCLTVICLSEGFPFSALDASRRSDF
jgi:hypothetical protein